MLTLIVKVKLHELKTPKSFLSQHVVITILAYLDYTLIIIKSDIHFLKQRRKTLQLNTLHNKRLNIRYFYKGLFIISYP